MRLRCPLNTHRSVKLAGAAVLVLLSIQSTLALVSQDQRDTLSTLPSCPMRKDACDVRRWGVQGDGRDDSSAVRACIAKCPNKCIHFPPGRYILGQVVLSGEDVHVHLSAGATLNAITDREAYFGPQSTWYALELRNCTRCSVTGSGLSSVIDGHSQEWVTDEIMVCMPNATNPVCTAQKGQQICVHA